MRGFALWFRWGGRLLFPAQSRDVKVRSAQAVVFRTFGYASGFGIGSRVRDQDGGGALLAA